MPKAPAHQEDDGRTIADMNVEGMPWYTPSGLPDSVPGPQGKETLNRRQRLSAYGGILAAVAVVTVVFGLVYFLAILLMDAAWR